MMVAAGSCKAGKNGVDPLKYVRYTAEQVEELDRLYHECPKPTSIRRQQLIKECHILSNIDSKQIKVWFQNRRCREKQRKETSRLQTLNRKLSAMNKLLMDENDRLQKQVSQLVYGNRSFCTPQKALPTTDTSCDSVVTTLHHPPPPPGDPSTPPTGLLSIAEESLAEFLSKATGTAVEWVQMPGMKPGPDSVGIVSIAHGCTGVAARACGLISLEPTKVAEILKHRQSWFRDCRSVDVVNIFPTSNGGTVELLYMQLYAPTTLAPPRDFWLMRYTSILEDGCLVVCERSVGRIEGGPSMPSMQNFVRAKMFPSGFLIRPCDGGESVIHIVNHFDFESWSVPEVIRPLYESPTVLSQKTTIAALRHLRQIAQETSNPNIGWGRRPTVLRFLSQRLSRGFNDAVNGFADENWSIFGSNDTMDDVTILINSSCSSKFTNGSQTTPSSILCAKASMLLPNIAPTVLLRFLRDHRSEWADSNIDVYSAAAVNATTPCNLPGSFAGGFGGQVILPLAHTIEHEEFLEVLKLENAGRYHDPFTSPDLFFLQLYRGVDESAIGTCSELIFAPIDASFADDAPLLPSGFRIIPLDPTLDGSCPNRTLDLASSLEVGLAGNKAAAYYSGGMTSVMTIAFQFAFENQLQDNVALMARQYVHRIITSVQRVALALSPSVLGGGGAGLRIASPGGQEASNLAHWISQSYKFHSGVELFKQVGEDGILKKFWKHSDAIVCCSLRENPTLTFANQSGLEMLETSSVALLDIGVDKILGGHGGKTVCMEFLQQGFRCLEGGICVSSKGRGVSYASVMFWKVLNDDYNPHCFCFMFHNWWFV